MHVCIHVRMHASIDWCLTFRIPSSQASVGADQQVRQACTRLKEQCAALTLGQRTGTVTH